MPLKRRRSEKTETQYQWALNAFFKAAGKHETYSERRVESAIEKLEKKYKPSSVSYIFNVCKKAIPNWPKDLLFEFSARSTTRPVVTEDGLRRMIRASVSIGDPLPAAYLALSSVYGARACELASVQNSDVDLSRGLIFIRTRKRGIPRDHMIPKPISRFVSAAAFEPVSESFMDSMYRLIESAAGIEHQPRVGWHSIRRALVTGLAAAGVPKLMADKFMRWKEKGMFEHYAMIDASSDQRIFDVHPFLPLWEEISEA